ncbi:hypothetical protein GGX14DRAFT_349486, partial [Mycena pura]
TRSRPAVSSPLADHTAPATTRVTPLRAYSFPTSSPLRPFLSVAPGKKPVKIIQPPANHSVSFELNLTQAELGRK